MSKSQKAILTAVVLVIIGVSWSLFVKRTLDRAAPETTVYLPPDPVPDFSLVESHGQAVTRADLLGKIWVANLMFTSCGDTCPALSASMSKLDRALGARADLRLVSITITPEYDQPPILREYAERFHASEKWLFLTGQRAVITKLANDGFWLSAGTPGTVTHSDKFVLVDREGRVRGMYDGLKPESIPQLVEAIKKLESTTPAP